MQHDSTLQEMANGTFNNLNAQPYFFKNSLLNYVRFQPNLESSNQMPEFESCTLYACNTNALKSSAVLYFSGKCVLYNCTFVKGQVIVIDNDIELYNCKNVKIRFESQKAYSIKASNTDIAIDGVTSTNVTKYSPKFTITGGRLELPKFSTYATWSGDIDGATIVIGDGLYPAINATGCTIVGENLLYMRNVTGCTVLFGGSALKGEIGGISFTSSEVRSANETSWVNKKKEIVFGAFVNIGNNVQGVYNNSAMIEMKKGSDAQVVYGNYNGETIFNG